MKVGFLQYPVIQRYVVANLEYIESKIKDINFDLLVLPEFFTSGYAFDTKNELLPFVENLKDSFTVKFLTDLAKESGGCIVGTIPEIEDDKIYNTAIIVGANGLIGSYRKIHLPDYEKRFFTSGNSIKPFDFNGVNIGITICFDCWFAPVSSKLKEDNVQIICHPSCFGGEVTPTIIPIRALENQCFIISCNRIGEELFDGELESYRGESQIVDPDGKVLFKANNKEELIFIDIDLSKVNKPDFGSYITSDFLSEHSKYKTNLK